jgi:hypothetical protein
MNVPRVVTVASLLIVMTACTGGTGNDGVPTAAGGPAGTAGAQSDDPVARERSFVACMRKAGVDMPDPLPGDTSGRSALAQAIDQGLALKDAFQTALDGCAAYLPPEEAPTPATPADVEKKRQFAQCMRDNGVRDFPDPDPATGELNGWIRRDDQTAVAAAEKCRDLLPGSASAGSATTVTR